MSEDFKATDLHFFTNFKKVEFKSYNEKNCTFSQEEIIEFIEN